MIKSKFILDIFDLLFDGDEIGKTLRRQIDYLTEDEYEYTGIGVFVKFAHSDEIKKYSIKSSDIKNIDLTAFNGDEIIEGVIIRNEKEDIEADATVFLKDGIIDYLEIWNRLGDYPDKELDNYILTQEWKDSPGRQIIKPAPNSK